jgi:hypothetical protein
MAYPIRFWAILLICLLLYQFSSDVSADWCKYEKNIDVTLDLADSELLAITAGAGELEVRGVAGSSDAVIRGKVCVSKEAWLDEAQVHTMAGKQAKISADLPTNGGSWSLFGNSYASMDLVIEVPQDLALEIKDSSGDIEISQVAALRLHDSSGDIEIENSNGPISIKDSSGDIDVDHVTGNFTIESDSSGDIYASNIDGIALVKKDSSGDIRLTQVSSDAIIEVDSSGEIVVKDVGGDFRVLKDGSGGIRSSNVDGEIQLPRDG